MNEFIAFRQDYLKVPNKIGELEVSEEQQNSLKAGEAVKLENMIDKQGGKFSVYVQKMKKK
ncbi:MAG: DUF3945 domain-containing protein [Bacteroidales bacterium]